VFCTLFLKACYARLASKSSVFAFFEFLFFVVFLDAVPLASRFSVALEGELGLFAWAFSRFDF
jgi:hypothetical protein